VGRRTWDIVVDDRHVAYVGRRGRHGAGTDRCRRARCGSGVVVDWLRRDPDLRGRLRLSASQGLPDAMGASSDLLLQLGGATVGAGTIWAGLATAMSTWLVQRRSDLTVSVTGPDGRTVRLSAKRVADAERL